MPYKDPIKAKEYQKNRYQKLKKEREAQHRDYERNRKAELLRLIGDRCVICGTTKRLIFHEIYGSIHECSRKYYREHPQDFITLCRIHHSTVHSISNYPEVINFKFVPKVQLQSLTESSIKSSIVTNSSTTS